MNQTCGRDEPKLWTAVVSEPRLPDEPVAAQWCFRLPLAPWQRSEAGDRWCWEFIAGW